MLKRIRRRVVKVPDKTVHPLAREKRRRRANPIHRNGMLAGGFFQRLGLIRAGIAPHEMILRIKDFKLDRRFCCACQVVIDDGAIGRIFPCRNFRRQGRVRISIPAEPNCFLRCEEMHTFLGNVSVHLPNRRDVIKNPERPSVRGDDQIVAMNREIAHGSVREIEL